MLSRISDLSHPLQAARSAPIILKWLRATGADLINAYISDPVLRGVVAGQSGDHGLPPSQVSAFMHAGITYHYLDGGYYPLGGAIRLQSRVRRLLVEGKKSAGLHWNWAKKSDRTSSSPTPIQESCSAR